MRTSYHSMIAPVLLLMLALAGCTTPVPATVTRGPSVALKPSPKVFTQTNSQHPRIMSSLRDAGVDTVDSFAAADYILDVRVGRSRRTLTCGGTSNVSYVLKDQRRAVLVIKARGQTGRCSPNVLDDMSTLLASYVGG